MSTALLMVATFEVPRHSGGHTIRGVLLARLVSSAKPAPQSGAGNAIVDVRRVGNLTSHVAKSTNCNLRLLIAGKVFAYTPETGFCLPSMERNKRFCKRDKPESCSSAFGN